MNERCEHATEAVRDYLAAAPFSGVVRIAEGDEVVLEEAGGLADRATGTRNELATRFGIASVTKMFTAAAVCRLVDQGQATFDTRVTEVLERDQLPTTWADEITLHHLLTHTSGIADYFDEVNLGAAAYDQIWLDHPSYLFTEPSDFLTLFRDLEPLRGPGGDVASYCNAGFIVLGLLIEKLAGTTYIDYVTTELFAPAGMNDSAFFRLDDIRPRVAIGYVEDPSGQWKTNHYSIPIVGGPDGGAYSTVRDLSRFLDALEGSTLFSERTFRQMSTRHVTNEGLGYGYGLAVVGDGVTRCFGHGGADPGFSARAFRYPELDVNVTTLGNTIDETDGVIEVFRTAFER